MPFYDRYDYVQVWTYNWGTDGFDWHWQDDFNGLDYSKWQVSNNWGFDGNNCLFMYDNVWTQDGALTFRMDRMPYLTEEEKVEQVTV